MSVDPTNRRTRREDDRQHVRVSQMKDLLVPSIVSCNRQNYHVIIKKNNTIIGQLIVTRDEVFRPVSLDERETSKSFSQSPLYANDIVDMCLLNASSV